MPSAPVIASPPDRPQCVTSAIRIGIRQERGEASSHLLPERFNVEPQVRRRQSLHVGMARAIQFEGPRKFPFPKWNKPTAAWINPW
jgi:hypothetical protein